MIFGFAFMGLDHKKPTLENIKEYAAISPRKICFSTCHAHALKRKENDKGVGTFSVPFKDSIKPIFEEITGLKLFSSAQYGNFWCGIRNEEEYTLIDSFTSDFGEIVFLRDTLEISLALSEHFQQDNTRTQIGELEYQAKYKNCAKSTSQLVEKCKETIRILPFYNKADIVCAVPPSIIENDSLPRKLANGIANEQLLDISKGVRWSKNKDSVKEESIENKLNLLHQTGLEINENVKEKTIILIDDLYQSGTTMQYVAMRLKEAGANRVFGLSLVKSRSNTDNL